MWHLPPTERNCFQIGPVADCFFFKNFEKYFFLLLMLLHYHYSYLYCTLQHYHATSRSSITVLLHLQLELLPLSNPSNFIVLLYVLQTMHPIIHLSGCCDTCWYCRLWHPAGLFITLIGLLGTGPSKQLQFVWQSLILAQIFASIWLFSRVSDSPCET